MCRCECAHRNRQRCVACAVHRVCLDCVGATRQTAMTCIELIKGKKISETSAHACCVKKKLTAARKVVKDDVHVNSQFLASRCIHKQFRLYIHRQIINKLRNEQPCNKQSTDDGNCNECGVSAVFQVHAPHTTYPHHPRMFSRGNLPAFLGTHQSFSNGQGIAPFGVLCTRITTNNVCLRIAKLHSPFWRAHTHVPRNTKKAKLCAVTCLCLCARTL